MGALLNEFHEFAVARHHVVLYLIRSDLGEELPGTFDLRFLDLSQLHRRH